MFIRYGPSAGGKAMMDFEFVHANEALKSGLYVGFQLIQVTYYSDAKRIECGRVGSKSKCFCGHLYSEHDVQAMKKKITSKCKGCACKEFKFVPTRPEECGMYWLPRRKEFKVSEWKAKCKCKLPHDAHKPVAPYMGPGCNGFYSDFACIACDCRWEDHSTLFEYEDERRMQGKKVGKEYLPLSMNQELHDLVFHTDRDKLPNYNRTKPVPGAIKAGQQAHAIGYDDEEELGDDRYLNPAEHRNYLEEKAHIKAISNAPYKPAPPKQAPTPSMSKPVTTLKPSPQVSQPAKAPTATKPSTLGSGLPSFGATNYNANQRKRF